MAFAVFAVQQPLFGAVSAIVLLAGLSEAANAAKLASLFGPTTD